MGRMKMQCPHCKKDNSKKISVVRRGSFGVKRRSRAIPLFYCKECSAHFSSRTTSDTKGYRKLEYLETIRKLIVSGVSRRQIARVLGINVKTVERYFLLLGRRAGIEMKAWRAKFRGLKNAQFDEMESHCHTKCKPVSIPLVVTPERHILAVSVCSMPAKGKLAKIAYKKYGPRKDGRHLLLRAVLSVSKASLSEHCTLLSDCCPRYPRAVKQIFAFAKHETVEGGRGCVAGHGELKEKRWDPMFALNHTAAMIRDHLATLKRRTWTSTKKCSRLLMLLQIYACHHNREIELKLEKKQKSAA